MMDIIIKIFLTFVKIGAFSFGGGYAMIPFIEKELVKNHQWLTPQEFVDIIAIAEMTPGPVAVNSSTFAGYKVANVPGSVAGTVGVVLVSFLLMTILSKSLNKVKDTDTVKNIFKGIRPAVMGLILSAAFSVGKTTIVDIKSLIISLVVLVLVIRKKVHPILSIVIAGGLGLLIP